MDELDALGPAIKIDRRATDWGMVSLAIGGFFLVMAPIQLFFNDFYWSIGIHRAAPDEIQNGRIVAPVVVAGFLGLIAFGLFAGIRGMILARATGYPVALPLGGILVCAMDMVLWIGLGLNFMGILGMFL